MSFTQRLGISLTGLLALVSIQQALGRRPRQRVKGLRPMQDLPPDRRNGEECGWSSPERRDRTSGGNLSRLQLFRRQQEFWADLG